MSKNTFEITMNSLELSRYVGFRHSNVKKDIRVLMIALGEDPDGARESYEGHSRMRTVLTLNYKVINAYAETQGPIDMARVKGLLKGLKYENKLRSKHFHGVASQLLK